ncbi:hypothetical protein ACFY04_14375 [Streptomyces sp. NPDC001549]|uniref:hypothetical protein n=1 Tax=Streptomyces sp. NPDC001549 TaxID=3364586 RepID=UPI0036C0601A
MRRRRARAFAAALLLISVAAPVAPVAPAAASPAPPPVAVPDRQGDDCAPDGLGPELTARLDRAAASRARSSPRRSPAS